MKKTPTEILRPYVQEQYEAPDHVYLYHAIQAIQEYHAQFPQFHPTPTEAEINEAAESNCPDTLADWSKEAMYKAGWKDAIQWLQNYQTQGRQKPVENTANLINRLKDRLSSQDEVQTSWVINHLDEILSQLQASQPNPAIAVIEALIEEYKELQNSDVQVRTLEYAKETILKKIKP